MSPEEAQEKMNKSVVALEDEYKTLRTGRASTAMVAKLQIEQYGQLVPLNQAAAVSTPDPRTIAIKPWDKSVLSTIDRVIHAANLGFTPSNDGNIIRISIPPLSEERRKEVVKQAKQIAEKQRVAIRNIRRSAKEELHAKQKASEISEDEMRRSETQLDKETESHIARIDVLLVKKEKDIMEE